MALAVTSTAIAFLSSNSGTEQSFQPSDRFFPSLAALNLSWKRSLAVKALNVEHKRNDSIVPSAATVFAPDLEKASPFEIMDKALEKYG
ncbi:hypothetical protein L1987_33944 [Smallanthus sonchifolius]|uniref:Uncharacterized protein n=1 Tax=Smallanthus sonchifolius TaxID=185202 RepID=A0ACB9HT58_9ASTR|nr:hypothetical protein L1987_33944 [Smallanthus sonchifolius]